MNASLLVFLGTVASSYMCSSSESHDDSLDYMLSWVLSCEGRGFASVYPKAVTDVANCVRGVAGVLGEVGLAGVFVVEDTVEYFMSEKSD